MKLDYMYFFIMTTYYKFIPFFYFQIPALQKELQIHRDFQQLIEITSSGFNSLKNEKTEVKASKLSPGTESTLTIKVEGKDKEIIEQIKKAIIDKIDYIAPIVIMVIFYSIYLHQL